METKKDIFLWANQADANKSELSADLFFFSKNYTVYSVNHSKDLAAQLRALFLYDMIGSVTTGAATGMAIRDIHTETDQDNVIDTTALETVPNAQSVFEQISFGEDQITMFSEEDHDIKRMKGVVARFYTDKKEAFYIVKLLQPSNVISGSASWALGNSGFKPMPVNAAVRITPDNQVLVMDEQIFVFNSSKFTCLFAYDAKRKVKIDGKITEIEKHFKLSFPDGLSLKSLVDANPQLADKLLRTNPASVDQDKMIETADEFQLALMQDDAGAFIIMDKRDLTIFANLLNDDYVESNTSGTHYLAGKKTEVDAASEAQVNLGL